MDPHGSGAEFFFLKIAIDVDVAIGDLAGLSLLLSHATRASNWSSGIGIWVDGWSWYRLVEVGSSCQGGVHSGENFISLFIFYFFSFPTRYCY